MLASSKTPRCLASGAVARHQLLYRGGGPVDEVDEHDTQAAARFCGALAACCQLLQSRIPDVGEKPRRHHVAVGLHEADRDLGDGFGGRVQRRDYRVPFAFDCFRRREVPHVPVGGYR
jgi:hypothetical protein